MGLQVELLMGHLSMTWDEQPTADLRLLLGAAVAHTETQLGFALDDVAEFPRGLPDDVKLAVFMLAAHWYAQRESVVVGMTAQTVPHGYDDVIRSRRRWTFG